MILQNLNSWILFQTGTEINQPFYVWENIQKEYIYASTRLLHYGY